MNSEWRVRALGDICTFENGDRGENYPSKAVQTTSGVPFINAGHLSENGLDFSSMSFIPRERFDLLGNGKITPNDILFCLRGSLGKFASVGPLNEGAIASSLVIIRPSDQLISEFLLAYLRSDLCSEMIRLYKNGAAQPNLSAASLRKFLIPLPPVAEQRRIVGILDEAFAGIAVAKQNAQQNLQNARALFESHLQAIFTQRGDGWVIKRLEDLTTKIGSGATPRGGQESYKREGVSLIRSLNVHDDGFRRANLAFLDDAQAAGLANVVVEPLDVLLNITGASVARCCLAPAEVLPARVNQHVSIIRPIKTELDAEFLHYLLISRPYKRKLLAIGEDAGSTRQAITKRQIQDFEVAYPKELNDQKKAVCELNGVRLQTQRLAALYQQKLTALDELKKSLLARAFAGELAS